MRRALSAALAAGSALVLYLATASAPALAATHEPTTPVRHFVYMMQGSATYDHYFGTYGRGDGLPANTCLPLITAGPGAAGSDCVRPFALHGTDPEPLSGGTAVERAQYRGGAMDGFASAFQHMGRDGRAPMGYFDRRDLPVSWRLADDYVLFDRFFAASQDGARTNRSYWVAAGPPRPSAGPVATSGALDQPTIFDRLQQAGVSWKFYVQDYDPHETFQARGGPNPTTQALRVPLLEQARFVTDPALSAHIVDLSEYRLDLARGTLPAVSFVAASRSGERSPGSIPAGQRLIQGMVDGLATSRYWTSSAMLIGYDSPGGWYDHVPPPEMTGQRLGFRVPALLVGAYARPGHVESTPLDSSAGLAFIERNWGLAPLTERDGGSAGLDAAFDFASPPRAPAVVAPTAATTPAFPTRTAPVYWLYGLGALAALVLVVGAFVAVRAERRGPRRPTGVHRAPDEKESVP